MVKKADKEAVKRLNQRIDTLIQGNDLITDKDGESKLLNDLNQLHFSDSTEENIRERVLAGLEEKRMKGKTRIAGKGMILRPAIAAALCSLMILGVTSALYHRITVKPHTAVQVTTQEVKTEQIYDINDRSESHEQVGSENSTNSQNIRNLPKEIPQNDIKSKASSGIFSVDGILTGPEAEPMRVRTKSYNFSSELVETEMPMIQGWRKKERFYDHNTESYNRIHENRFLTSIDNPLSTFSIDVDTASYANLRRYINQGQLPPKDAVRIEEMINYFTYDYPQPSRGRPFSVTAEMADCPWNDDHKLVRIGLQGQKIDMSNAPPNNLVFLVDVSGSMDTPNRLPLVKSSLRLLVQELRPQDRVAIVVYAGAAGLVLPPTSGEEKETITHAMERLEAGGSTAGGEGIRLAYATARRHFMKNGNNRVILATDGDFNVGVSSDAEMERLIEREREDGIFLSVLGYGMGNYKDSKMETLANKGNGNYAYIDSIQEAKKVLVEQMGGTLLTIAKDVKIQVEFNPARIRSYRLIGYENRALAAEDFDDDKKDAGELGAGHSVTALYEVELNRDPVSKGRALKYQQTRVKDESFRSNEYLTINLRYKEPNAQKSQLITVPLTRDPLPLSAVSQDFRFAAAVAAFGMILRDSEHMGTADINMVYSLAREAMGKDVGEYRQGFLDLVGKSQKLMDYQLKQ